MHHNWLHIALENVPSLNNASVSINPLEWRFSRSIPVLGFRSETETKKLQATVLITIAFIIPQPRAESPLLIVRLDFVNELRRVPGARENRVNYAFMLASRC